jgi:acyl-CoA reductase-like NAD-dependent aldehyde dehydrogenase
MTRDYITSFDPATGAHIGTFMADNEDDIKTRIIRATEAQETWRTTTFTQRRRVIRSLMKWLVDNQKGCAQVACRDTGKTCKSRVCGDGMPALMCWRLFVCSSDRCRTWRNNGNLLKDGVVDSPWRTGLTS